MTFCIEWCGKKTHNIGSHMVEADSLNAAKEQWETKYGTTGVIRRISVVRDRE